MTHPEYPTNPPLIIDQLSDLANPHQVYGSFGNPHTGERYNAVEDHRESLAAKVRDLVIRDIHLDLIVAHQGIVLNYIRQHYLAQHYVSDFGPFFYYDSYSGLALPAYPRQKDEDDPDKDVADRQLETLIRLATRENKVRRPPYPISNYMISLVDAVAICQLANKVNNVPRSQQLKLMANIPRYFLPLATETYLLQFEDYLDQRRSKK